MIATLKLNQRNHTPQNKNSSNNNWQPAFRFTIINILLLTYM